MADQKTYTALAHPNIALIKYWGKQDEELIIPETGSVSFTLDAFETRTSVTLDPRLQEDFILLNGEEPTDSSKKRIIDFLNLVRSKSGSEQVHATVVSENTVPTAAGLASSASGFAALALATSAAYGLSLEPRDLSALARKGSGSASRSIFGDFVYWQAGDTDETSFASPLKWDGPEISVLIAVVSAKQKEISSRDAMVVSKETSPYYSAWARNNEELVQEALIHVQKGDFENLGRLMELSTMRMHATLLAADPAIHYLTPKSYELFEAVRDLRDDGFSAYATADAGPNVKIFCPTNQIDSVAAKLESDNPGVQFVRSGSGGPARLVT